MNGKFPNEPLPQYDARAELGNAMQPDKQRSQLDIIAEQLYGQTTELSLIVARLGSLLDVVRGVVPANAKNETSPEAEPNGHIQRLNQIRMRNDVMISQIQEKIIELEENLA